MIDTCKHCNKRGEILTFKTGENELVDACKSCRNDLIFILRVLRVGRYQFGSTEA